MTFAHFLVHTICVQMCIVYVNTPVFSMNFGILSLHSVDTYFLFPSVVSTTSVTVRQGATTCNYIADGAATFVAVQLRASTPRSPVS